MAGVSDCFASSQSLQPTRDQLNGAGILDASDNLALESLQLRGMRPEPLEFLADAACMLAPELGKVDDLISILIDPAEQRARTARTKTDAAG